MIVISFFLIWYFLAIAGSSVYFVCAERLPNVRRFWPLFTFAWPLGIIVFMVYCFKLTFQAIVQVFR